jgi:sporulation protein YlmC with PRC-barrel domain
MKTLATAAALAALLASPAFAQDTYSDEPPAATQDQAPDAGAPADPNAAAQPSDEGSAVTDDSAATSDGSAVTEDLAQAEKFIGQQQQEELLASEFIGATVYNSADENLGSVSDIVLAKEGGIEAAVIGVGGFLGIGAKNVAVSFDEIEQSTDEDGNLKLILNASKEELDAAPEYTTLAEMKRESEANQPADPMAAPPADPMAPAPAEPAEPAQPAPAQ